MKGTLRLVLIAVCLAVIPTLAAASNAAPAVAITSPEAGLTIASKLVVVKAAFSAPEGAVIRLLELVVDGVTVESRELDPGEAAGNVSFTWIAREYEDGEHAICVRAIDSEGQVADNEISAWLQSERQASDTRVRITSPAEGEKVSGKTTVQVDIDDPHSARYVIFLVDDVFRAMSNVRPFTYAWDTTRYLNGPHNLKAKVYFAGEWEAVSPTVQVNVDNPSGATAMRAPKLATAAVAPSPMLPPSRASEPVLPAPMRTESPTSGRLPVALNEPEVAVPGTAPFISPSGELITPPTPVEIAAFPTSGSTVRATVPMTAGPARTPDSAALTASEPVGPVAVVPRAPVSAPIEVAMLDSSVVAPVATASVPSVPSVPPATVAASSEGVEAAAAPNARILDTEGARTSQIEIAMLPPRPVERQPAPKVTAEPAPSEVVYVVHEGGDWLARVARETGVPAGAIARANNLGNQRALQPGQTLRIPSTPLYVDNRPVQLDAPAVVVDGRAIVPFRSVIEAAGGTVTWDSAERCARATARSAQIAVTIGTDIGTVNDRPVQMGTAAAIRCDRTVVPLRFLGDALDMVLQYEDGVIHIASGF